MGRTSLHFACHVVGRLSEMLRPLKVELCHRHMFFRLLICIMHLLDNLGRN